jgi:hypothetical protein
VTANEEFELTDGLVRPRIEQVAKRTLTAIVQMPRIVISVVSLAAVLLHLGEGCCAHHWHLLEADSSQATAVEHEHGHAHHPGEHAQRHGHSCPSDDSAPDDCHESHCSMVLSVPLEAPPAAVAGDWLLLTDEQVTSSLQSACGNDFYLAASADSPLPLRAHLRLGVLRN